MIAWLACGPMVLGTGSRLAEAKEEVERAAPMALPRQMHQMRVGPQANGWLSKGTDAVGLHPMVGERLSFQGLWFGLPVGSGWIEVRGLVNVAGRRAYHVEAQGDSNALLSSFYPIHDVIHSYLDANTLMPLRFEKSQHEGQYRAEEVVTFDAQGGLATYHSLLNGSQKTIPLPADFQDLISALYWFRRQPLEAPGTLRVLLYTDEKLYHTTVRINGPSVLGLLNLGDFRCLVVEPKASFKGFLVKRGRLWAYLTDDVARIPVMVKATTPWGVMSAVIDKASLEAIQGSFGRSLR